MVNGSHHAEPYSTPPSSPHAAASFLSILDRIRTVLARTASDETSLRDDAWPSILKRIHGALDTGKSITGAGPNRGLPMNVVVQTLKASWHVDGTWPIGPNAMQRLEEQSKSRAEKDKGPEGKQDPSPEDVAKRYRERGVVVAEMETVRDDDW